IGNLFLRGGKVIRAYRALTLPHSTGILSPCQAGVMAVPAGSTVRVPSSLGADLETYAVFVEGEGGYGNALSGGPCGESITTSHTFGGACGLCRRAARARCTTPGRG